jgi:hypothetical protein
MKCLSLIAAACLALPPSAHAADKALLVGVSSYPALPKHLQLAGPANDVRLMRDMLVRAGLSEANIRVLASGAAKAADAPTRAAILAALADLAATESAGDASEPPALWRHFLNAAALGCF